MSAGVAGVAGDDASIRSWINVGESSLDCHSPMVGVGEGRLIGCVDSVEQPESHANASPVSKKRPNRDAWRVGKKVEALKGKRLY